MSGNNVSDISSEGTLQRVMRDHALAALMVVLTLVTMINGVIIGVAIAVMANNGEKMDQVRRTAEANQAWQARLVGAVEARGIEVPPLPKEN